MKNKSISDSNKLRDTSNLRLVIFDNPKQLIENCESSARMFTEVIRARQAGYNKASLSYISMDKLDMIGTHVLICEVSNIFKPTVIAGLRLSYNDRCKEHGLKLPMDDNIQHATLPSQVAYKNFNLRHRRIVEANAFFVDDQYTYKKSNINFPQLLTTGLVMHSMRLGYSNFIAATNERFKASRWVDFGAYSNDNYFIHPSMPDKHKIILMDEYYIETIERRFHSLDKHLQNRFELISSKTELASYEAVKDKIAQKGSHRLKLVA